MSNALVPTGPRALQPIVNPFAAYRSYAMAKVPFYYFPGYQLPGSATPQVPRIQIPPPLTYHNGILTTNAMHRLVMELRKKQIPLFIFAFTVLDMTETALTQLITYPKPWDTLTKDHDVYETIVDWIMLCDNDQLAVVEFRQLTCCRFKTLWQRRELERIQKLQIQEIQECEADLLLQKVRLAIRGAPTAQNHQEPHQNPHQKPMQQAIKAPEVKTPMFLYPVKMLQNQKPVKVNIHVKADPQIPQDSVHPLDLQLTEGSEILTANLAKRIEFELKERRITKTAFADILQISQASLATCLSKPKPWDRLRGTQNNYIKIFNWLQMSEEEKMELSGGARTPYTKFTDAQRAHMEQVFSTCRYPNRKTFREMANELKLNVHTIRDHFRKMRCKARTQN